MKLQVKCRGGFDHTERLLKNASSRKYLRVLDEYGQAGVAALQRATPKDSGVTAESWTYSIEETKSGVNLIFSNSHVEDGVPIAIILEYGHATGSGGYVEGRDYINPALLDVFNDLKERVRTEVRRT